MMAPYLLTLSYNKLRFTQVCQYAWSFGRNWADANQLNLLSFRLLFSALIVSLGSQPGRRVRSHITGPKTDIVT